MRRLKTLPDSFQNFSGSAFAILPSLGSGGDRLLGSAGILRQRAGRRGCRRYGRPPVAASCPERSLGQRTSPALLLAPDDRDRSNCDKGEGPA
jgi:hypothetical protein